MDWKTNLPKRAAIYARVSTEGQTPENQLMRLREVAARAGWNVAEEFVETVSGAAKARPEFDRMMREVRRRRIDLIAAVDLTRLGRTTIGLLHLLDELGQSGCDLYVDREALDTTTAAGRMMYAVVAAIAAFERELLIERTKAGMARARARGKQIGRAPASDALIDAIRALRADGMGMDRIARNLKCGKGLSQRVCQEFDKETADG
ncbi:MAG: recombinase family protein [Alphaproteobacteria bacterium]|nr:recombinase family protein [Alphaproteobacteria bacterium]MBU2076499.1 recombinase family protein [Alphaproteobacteria bacterium]MBU2160602.1 recombinase family protein [Alphaproteobacteria bacterium]MBU2244406.1 recombinase family protein [Alphaproteobacteria bacterium]